MSSAFSPPEARGFLHPRVAGIRWLLMLAVLCVPAVAGAQEGTRVAYVDMKRLIDNAPQLVDAQARLTREFQARNLRFEAEKQRLAELEARQAASASDDAAAALRAGEINALRRSVERNEQSMREQLATRLDEEIDVAFPRLSEAVADYAREQGYDLVVQSPVIYASGRIDITDAVLDRLRREARGSSR
jgi:outer membrane protein